MVAGIMDALRRSPDTVIKSRRGHSGAEDGPIVSNSVSESCTEYVIRKPQGAQLGSCDFNGDSGHLPSGSGRRLAPVAEDADGKGRRSGDGMNGAVAQKVDQSHRDITESAQIHKAEVSWMEGTSIRILIFHQTRSRSVWP